MSKKLRRWLSLALILLLLAGVGPPLYREAQWFYRERNWSRRVHSSGEETVMAYAMAHGYSLRDWPESLIALLDRNPETKDFVLSYPAEHARQQEVDLSRELSAESVPLFLQWDKRWGYLQYGSDMAGLTGCGPTCLSMVACYLTGDAAHSPDNMIRFALDNGYCSPGNGSSWTLISQGAGKLGLTATELPLVKKTIFSHLEAGRPVICVMGPGDFTASGHFIVMTGLKDGLICVNDPNSRANSQKLWDFDQISDQIRNLWMLEKAPVG